MRIRPLRVAILILLVLTNCVRAVPPAPESEAEPPKPQQPIYLFFGAGKPVEAEFNKLSDKGITPFLDYFADFMANPSGGLLEGHAYTHEMLFGAEFDFGKLAHLDGSYFTISGAQSMGPNLSQKIGNIFTVSQSYVTPGLRFYQCFWKQQFDDDKLVFHLGRLTPSSQFASLPTFGLQASGGINGNPTSLFLNAPFTSSPDATWGGTAKYRMSKDIYIAGGLYQATSSTTNRNYYGLNFAIHPSQDGLLALDQIGWEPTFGAAKGDDSKAVADEDTGLPGDYLVGDYYSNYDFPQLNAPGIEHNAFGFFAMAQQMVWRQKYDPHVSVSLWGGATYSPQVDIAMMPAMGFAGVVWQGAIPGRDLDQVLLSYLIGGLSNDYADAVVAAGGARLTTEQVIEASYVVQLNKRVSVQPDIQYVIQPGGDSQVPNAVVLGLQITATF